MDDKWLEITMEAAADTLDEVCAKLTGAGLTGLVVEDEADFRAFLEQNRQYWDYVDDVLLERMKGAARVKFYVTDDADGHALLDRYAKAAGLSYTAASLSESDWAHSWQKYYKPMPVGRRLYIVPDWERDAPVPSERTPVYLNPGLTFGTGSHASTQLCLEGVERYTREGGAVLDLGCGSGILSVAALRLGAAYAAAVDIDSKAIGVAYENAALNGIGRESYTVLSGDVLSDEALFARLADRRYQLVLANIVADVIIPLSRKAADLLTGDGLFLCSGIIDTRADEVAEALSKNGLIITERTEKNNWVAFCARRRD